jgi:hypothetical protein
MDKRSIIHAVGLMVMLTCIPWNARGQTSSSSRPLSATVMSTYIARNGELVLLVLWRGSPGWNSGGGSSGSGGSSAGREFGSFTLTSGGRTLSIDIDYTARLAKILGQEITLDNTNVVLVDDVDGPSGARIVSRLWVDPKLPAMDISGVRRIENEPAIAAIRRAPEAQSFLQCDIPIPLPPGMAAVAADPIGRARATEYVQEVMGQICRAAIGP